MLFSKFLTWSKRPVGMDSHSFLVRMAFTAISCNDIGDTYAYTKIPVIKYLHIQEHHTRVRTFSPSADSRRRDTRGAPGSQSSLCICIWKTHQAHLFFQFSLCVCIWETHLKNSCESTCKESLVQTCESSQTYSEQQSIARAAAPFVSRSSRVMIWWI